MAGGFATGMIITGNAKQAWSMSLKGAVSGGVVGGSFGAAGGYIYAKANNLNPWTGELIHNTNNNFFDGAYYSEKVLQQMKQNDFHGFPESVDAFSESGIIIPFEGGDGRLYQKLLIKGSYMGYDGYFEYIKDMNGCINHRLFHKY
jgi:hypothetical protein